MGDFKPKKIRVDCEESQTLTIALRKKGHEAYSCDIMPCSGDHSDWHIQGDCTKQDNSIYDFILSFPPCTHIATSGAKHFEKKRNDGRQESGIRFFFEVWKYSDMCENPMGILNGGGYIKKWFPDLFKEMANYGFPFKSTQIIQPWQFGDTAQKTTCLWLKNLPPLRHIGSPNLFNEPITHVAKGRFYISPGGKKMPSWMSDPIDHNGKKISNYGNDEIKKLRSKTFPGIAKAMAEQWF